MASNLPQLTTPAGRIDLTRVDFNGMKSMIYSAIREHPKYREMFSSFFEGDVAVMLIDLFLTIAHINNLRLDFISNELSFLNSRDPNVLLRFLPIIDYKLRSVEGSTIPLKGSFVRGSIEYPIVIPARTKISGRDLTGNSFTSEILYNKYNYTGNIIVPAGVDSFDVVSYAGQTKSISVQIDRPSNFAVKINQEFVIDDSIQVFLNKGGIFHELKRVDSFVTYLTSEFPDYTVRFDFDGKPTIIFGNRFFGGAFTGIVEGSSQTYENVIVYYRHLDTRNGAETNVTPFSIDDTIEVFVQNLGRNVSINFFNQFAATGGNNILSMEEVKRIAPLTVRASKNTVTNEDYEIKLINNNSIINDVRAITPKDQPDVNIPVFYGYIYVKPERQMDTFILSENGRSDRLPLRQTGETESEYNVRLIRNLNNFCNISGMETNAKLTSTNSSTFFTIINDFNDKIRLIVDDDDIVSGFVDVKLDVGLNVSNEDVVNKINSAFGYQLAKVDELNKIELSSRVYGTGSFIQFVGDNENAANNQIIDRTCDTIGFALNQFSSGQDVSSEAAAIDDSIENEIAGIGHSYKSIRVSPFGLDITVYYNPEVSSPDTLKDIVRQSLRDAYSFSSVNLGNRVTKNDVRKLVENIDGVDLVDINGFLENNRLISEFNECYFILDEIIIAAIPDSFPNIKANYDINIKMVRSDI